VRVTLTDPGLAGDYVVDERHEDGSLLLRPDTSAEAIARRLGVTPVSQEEFDKHFGHLPSDGEG